MNLERRKVNRGEIGSSWGKMGRNSGGFDFIKSVDLEGKGGKVVGKEENEVLNGKY